MNRNAWNDLSELEELVMRFICPEGSATSEDVRVFFAERRPMKDSTAWTILRRLEGKGYLTHSVEGRAYRYCPVSPGRCAAARAVNRIVNRFCTGSMEQLLIGMVDGGVIDGKELKRLAGRIAASHKTEGRKS